MAMPAARVIFPAPELNVVSFEGIETEALRAIALSSNMSGSRSFKPRDAGANPVEAAIFLKEAPIVNPRSETALPYRSIEASRRPEPGRGRVYHAFVA